MGERPVLFGMDEWTAAHLVVAIRGHREQMARSYQPVPDQLRQIEDWCSAWVRKGQEGSSLDGGGDVAEAAPMTEPLLLTLDRTAELLGVSVSTVKRLVAGDDPELVSVVIGNSRRVHRDDLDAYLAGKREAAA
jgi:excisionase family DNA binding protein